VTESFRGQRQVSEQRGKVVSCDGAERCSVSLVELLHAEAAGDVVVGEQADTDVAFRVAHSLRKNWSAALVDHAVDVARESGAGGETRSRRLRTRQIARSPQQVGAGVAAFDAAGTEDHQPVVHDSECGE
jgi:hypothetical protein